MDAPTPTPLYFAYTLMRQTHHETVRENVMYDRFDRDFTQELTTDKVVQDELWDYLEEVENRINARISARYGDELC